MSAEEARARDAPAPVHRPRLCSRSPAMARTKQHDSPPRVGASRSAPRGAGDAGAGKRSPVTRPSAARSAASPAPESDLTRAARILATVDSIPRGRVASYGQVALEAGLPRRARLVGRVLSELPAGSAIPWHRVVNAAGRISPRGGDGPREQVRRLRAEGVVVGRGGRIDLARFGW